MKKTNKTVLLNRIFATSKALLFVTLIFSLSSAPALTFNGVPTNCEDAPHCLSSLSYLTPDEMLTDGQPCTVPVEWTVPADEASGFCFDVTYDQSGHQIIVTNDEIWYGDAVGVYSSGNRGILNTYSQDPDDCETCQFFIGGCSEIGGPSQICELDDDPPITNPHFGRCAS